MENGSLIREPAKDFDKFVDAQENLIKTEFAGERIRRKRIELVTLYYARHIQHQLGKLLRRLNQTSRPGIVPDADRELFAVNLKIIQELGRQVHNAGSRLIVLDASKYFSDGENLPTILDEFCINHGFGYIPLLMIVTSTKLGIRFWPALFMTGLCKLQMQMSDNRHFI